MDRSRDLPFSTWTHAQTLFHVRVHTGGEEAATTGCHSLSTPPPPPPVGGVTSALTPLPVLSIRHL